MQQQIDASCEVLPAVTWYVDGEQDHPARRGPVAMEQPGHYLVPVRPVTIDDVLAQFQAWMRLDVGDGAASPQTLRAYLTDVRQHLQWVAATGLTPAQVTEDDMREFRAFLLEDGAPSRLEHDNPQAPERYAVSTVGRKLASVRRFYDMAHARGMLPENPAAGLKAPKDKTERSERVKYLTLVALQRVLQLPNLRTEKGIRDRCILALMAMHGLRVAEVAALDLECYEPEGGETGTLRVVGKGNKQRTVHLVLESREEIRRWLAVRNLMVSDESALFLSMHWSGEAQAGRMSTRGIRNMVDGYLEKAGAKREGVSCHSLRHSYATHSLAAGAKLPAISKSMGHAGIQTTMVYADIVDKARENPAKYLTGLLG